MKCFIVQLDFDDNDYRILYRALQETGMSQQFERYIVSAVMSQACCDYSFWLDKKFGMDAALNSERIAGIKRSFNEMKSKGDGTC